MSRTNGREQAFIFLFENSFNHNSLEKIVEYAKFCEGAKIYDFAKELFDGVMKNKEKIDSYIEKNAKGWKINRISKVAMAIMEIAVYEMINGEDVPVEILINEAVELAKKYGGDDEFAFINGVLGAVYKEVLKENEKQV